MNHVLYRRIVGTASLIIGLAFYCWPIVATAQTPVNPPVQQSPSVSSPSNQSQSPTQTSTNQQSDIEVVSPMIVEPLCTGASLDLTSNCDEFLATSTSGGDINNLVTNFINTLSLLVGVVAVIMIMVGGFRYIISGGDNSGVSAAKNTILYAIIGLIIVVFAQVIVRFVLRTVTTVS